MTGSQSPTASSGTDLRDLPPSAKLVAKVLDYEGDQTQGQLVDSTMLPERTVRHALSELEAADIVTSRISFMDARKSVYSLELDE